MLKTALIGYSGFVGQSLIRQTHFTNFYRSTNIQEIKGKAFDVVICAGAPAVKWLANKEPKQDWNGIEKLIDCLELISCSKFILISTVDVYSNSNHVTEESPIEEEGLHAYGLHRRTLEKFVQDKFDNHLIVRLPGLVGPGLKKNIIFDFANNNNLDAIDSRGIFQFYPMVNLWSDIKIAMQNNLKLIHLTSEPISVSEIAENVFDKKFTIQHFDKPAKYDFRTIHSQLYGQSLPYQYSKKETLLAIRSYFQSETLGVK